MAALLERGCHLELIVSDYGRRLLRDELGERAAVDKLADFLASTYGESVRAGTYTLHSNKDLGAKVASGSQNCEGMVVVPCSMKSLAGIAHGLSRNLVERAADVMLKERRTLIVVPRETPMSLPQLRNMVLCAKAGAMGLPTIPHSIIPTLKHLTGFQACHARAPWPCLCWPRFSIFSTRSTIQGLDPTACHVGWEVTLTTGQPRSAIEQVFLFVLDDMQLDLEQVAGHASEPRTAAVAAAVPSVRAEPSSARRRAASACRPNVWTT